MAKFPSVLLWKYYVHPIFLQESHKSKTLPFENPHYQLGEDCPFGLDLPRPDAATEPTERREPQDFATSTYQEMTNPIKMGGLCSQYHDATQDWDYPHAHIDSKTMAEIAKSQIVI